MATTTNNKNGVFRKKKVYFTQVSNVAIRDNNLSGKAKGLYALIQSFITIENFILYKSTLRKHMMEGEMAFEGMWKELKQKGYLIQYKMKNENGKFYYEYELLDEPNLELANEVHNPKKTAKTSHSNHPPKIKGVDKSHSGDVGMYNNTNLNNTDLNNTYSNRSSSSTEEIEEENNEVTVENNSKENENLNTLGKLCQNLNFKLKKTDMKILLLTYSIDDITRAIMTITSTSTFENNEIKNHKAYLVKTLNDMNTIKVENKNITVNNTITNESKKNSFTDYSQRDYGDCKALENQLLGWDEE